MNVNYYNPYVRQELYIMHHGIAGQKWGQRNGPPYPIAPSAHSASEKKAGWKRSIYKSGNDTHFSRKTERYISKAEKRGFDARSGQKSLNLLERQRAKDIYGQRKALQKGNKKEAEVYAKRVKEGRSKANSIIKELNGKGYTIGSAVVVRDANYGKKMFAVSVLGAPAAVATNVNYIRRRTANVVEGKRYKVSKDSNPNFLKKNDAGRDWDNRNNMFANVASSIYAGNSWVPGAINRRTNYRRVKKG